MKTSIIALTLTTLIAGLGAVDSADAGHRKTIKRKHVVTRKHVTKKKFARGRKVIIHKDVKKVVRVKKVTRVSHRYHGGPAYGYPAYRYPAYPAYPAPAYGYGGSYGSVSAIGSIGGFSFSFGAPVIYPMAPTYVYNQVWVEPVTETIVVGMDALGNPIYETVIMTPGLYRNARYLLLADGSREFVAYM